MIRGMIGPKGRPGYLVPHKTGVINLIGARRFVVDDRDREEGEKPACVVDEAGEDLVLTREVFDQVREGIQGGAPMFIEPLAGEDGAPGLAELEREFERAVEEIERRGQEIERLHSRNDELKSQAEQLGTTLRRAESDNAAAQAQLGEALKKIAELEQAATKKKKTE